MEKNTEQMRKKAGSPASAEHAAGNPAATKKRKRISDSAETTAGRSSVQGTARRPRPTASASYASVNQDAQKEQLQQGGNGSASVRRSGGTRSTRRRERELLHALEDRLGVLTSALDAALVSEKGIEMVKEIKELYAMLDAVRLKDAPQPTPVAAEPMVVAWEETQSAPSVFVATPAQSVQSVQPASAHSMQSAFEGQAAHAPHAGQPGATQSVSCAQGGVDVEGSGVVPTDVTVSQGGGHHV